MNIRYTSCIPRRFSVFVIAAVFVAASAFADGFHIRPYLQNIRPDGATICWESQDETPGKVQFGPEGKFDGEASQPQPAKIHKVPLSNLSPDTAYSYRVQAGDDKHEAAFKTAPGAPRPIAFAVIGDSRRWDKRWQETDMTTHMMQWKPEFCLNNGDLVLEGHKYDLWPAHFERFSGFNDKIMMVGIRGNHEGSRSVDLDNDWFGKYHEQPDGGEPFYSFDWGNTHITILSMDSLGSAVDQLDQDLAKSNAKYKFVLFHPPIFCTGYASPADDRKDSGDRMAAIWKVLDKHKVLVHLAGHTHIYERSFPLRDGKRDVPGTTYVVNGGDINANYPEWWTAVSDDRATMAKPTYSLFECKDDRIELRTFAWSTKENKVAEIDHAILYSDVAVAEKQIKALEEKKGADLAKAIEELGWMQYPPAAEILLPFVDNSDAAVRMAALKAIRSSVNADVSGKLVKLVKDADPAVSREAAWALENAMPKDASESVAKLAQDDHVDEVARVRLLGALQLHAPLEVTRDAAMRVLKGEAPESVRERAAYALARVAGDDDIKSMVKIVEKEPSKFALLALAHKLNQLTRQHIVEGDKGPLTTSTPGNRKEFAEKWLSGR